MSEITIEYYERPGRHLPELEVLRLCHALREVGEACFDELPDYQCFSGVDGLKGNVLTVARNSEGRMLGFSSALLLNVEGLKTPVLHLGLTCIHPDARGLRLTHRLASQLAVKYLLKNNPLGNIWISNVACVLSSVGNVALSFDQVYPSPFVDTPSRRHRKIARAISENYRDEIYIHASAPLDEEAFVFRGSVAGTMFQKSAEDTRYHHREERLNRYYKHIMNFDEGDEVVQIGRYSLATLSKYLFAQAFGLKKKIPASLPKLASGSMTRAA